MLFLNLFILSVGIFFLVTPDGCEAQAYKDVAVNEHNRYRSRHGAPNVSSHSTDINQYAQNWANHLATTDQFYHSGGSYGENLYKSWGGSDDRNVIMENAIKMWYDEIQYYNWNNPGFSSATGHFTQVVWRASTEIGVGIAVVPDASYRIRSVVCISYRPPGNYQGQFAQNVLRPTRSFDNLNSTVFGNDERPVKVMVL